MDAQTEWRQKFLFFVTSFINYMMSQNDSRMHKYHDALSGLTWSDIRIDSVILFWTNKFNCTMVYQRNR